MALADLDGRMGTETLFIEIAIKGVPHRELLVIFRHFNLILDVGYDDTNGLIVHITNIIPGLNRWDVVASVHVADIGSSATAIHAIQHITDLVIRNHNCPSLGIQSLERLTNRRRQIINVLT